MDKVFDVLPVHLNGMEVSKWQDCGSVDLSL